MWALVMSKRKIGHVLDSAPILADANCTMVCIYMSVVLLASSLIYQFTGFGFVDSLGALGLIYFSISEGRRVVREGGRTGGRMIRAISNQRSPAEAGSPDLASGVEGCCSAPRDTVIDNARSL